MKLLTTTCKDDFVSLGYFLVFLMDGNLNCLEGCIDFENIRKMKANMTVDNLCQSQKSHILKHFATEVFDLKYNDTLDYDKLKFLLIKELLKIE